MPRKLHKFGESAQTPERPGSGEPRSAKERALARMAETKANVAAGREHAKAEMQRRREEPKVLATEIKEEEKAAVEKVIERREPRNVEQEEMAAAASGEIDPLRADRMKRDALLLEKAELQERMQKMGGVWGGESYFVLSDKLEDVERALRLMDTGSKERPVEKSQTTEESFVAGEPTAQERVADARKTLKQMKRYEHDIEARQKKLQTELARYGIKSPAQIDAELSELSPELRESSAGANPGFWFKLRKMARGLAGMERSPEVKALLAKYVDLENEMNGELHKRREAELELESAEAAAGKTRVRLQVPLASVTEQPVYNVQQELAAVRALKMIEEEMQDDMMNFAGRKDEFTTEDLELYTEKLDSLNKRLQALDEGAGNSEAAAKAAREAKEIYVQYRRKLSQAASAIVGQAQTAGPGEARPPSVISTRARAAGSYGTSIPGRREASLLKMETADKKERSEWEKAGEKERVNRDVQVYRSLKWRKDVIDAVNGDESVRPAMHAVYEAYKKRVQEMMAKGELNLITGSPDPALDYTLDLYRLYARKENGKHAFNEKIASDASAGVHRVNGLLGYMWDEDGVADRLARALLSGKPKVVVDKAYLAEVAAANDNAEETELDESDLEEVAPIALTSVKPANEITEPVPLIHEKRSRSEQELEAIEKEEAVTEVPPVLVEPVIEQKIEAPTRGEELEEMISQVKGKLPELSDEEKKLREWYAEGARYQNRRGGWVRRSSGELQPASEANYVGRGYVKVLFEDPKTGKRLQSTIGLKEYRDAQEAGEALETKRPVESTIERAKPVVKREPSPEKKSKRKAKEAAKRARQAAVTMEGGGTVVDLGARRKEDRKARRASIKAKQTGGKSEESA